MGMEAGCILEVQLSHLPLVPGHPAGQTADFNVKYSFTPNKEGSGSSALPEKKCKKFWGSLLLVALGVKSHTKDIPDPGCDYLAVCSSAIHPDPHGYQISNVLSPYRNVLLWL